MAVVAAPRVPDPDWSHELCRPRYPSSQRWSRSDRPCDDFAPLFILVGGSGSCRERGFEVGANPGSDSESDSESDSKGLKCSKSGRPGVVCLRCHCQSFQTNAVTSASVVLLIVLTIIYYTLAVTVVFTRIVNRLAAVLKERATRTSIRTR